jgi:RHS repeat-associated protein
VTIAAFAYDGRNRCVTRTINGTARYFTWDNWSLIEERDNSGTLLEKYVHGAVIDEILVRYNGSPIYYHHDGLGSVTHLTDSAGSIVESYTYDVYGEASFFDSTSSPQPTSLQGNRFLFTGREWLGDVGLYDYRNRMYSQNLGRFLQTDPIRIGGKDVNLYRYVQNSVANQTDPLGLYICWSQQKYDTCFIPKKALLDNVLHAAQTWRDVQYKVAAWANKKCKNVCDLGPDWTRPSCYNLCDTAEWAAEKAADIQYDADEIAYRLALTLAVNYCTLQAVYISDCPCKE